MHKEAVSEYEYRYLTDQAIGSACGIIVSQDTGNAKGAAPEAKHPGYLPLLSLSRDERYLIRRSERARLQALGPSCCLLIILKHLRIGQRGAGPFRRLGKALSISHIHIQLHTLRDTHDNTLMRIADSCGRCGGGVHPQKAPVARRRGGVSASVLSAKGPYPQV